LANAQFFLRAEFFGNSFILKIFKIKSWFAKLREKSDESLTEIKDAASKIKASKRQILFQTKEVALWYAMGFYIPFALTLIVAFFLFYSGFTYEKRHSQEEIKQQSKIEKNLKKSSKFRSKAAKLGHFQSK
jgi:predicted PurR-regulated permease PerM